MYIKIIDHSQLELLRNVNKHLGKSRIPREVLHEIGMILEFKRDSDKDYIALFIKAVKNDTIGLFDKLHLHYKTIEVPDENISFIRVRGNRHPMKKKRTWCYYDVNNVDTGRKVFVIYSIKNKHLNCKGGF